MKFILYNISGCVHFPFQMLFGKEKLKKLKQIMDFRKLNIYYLAKVPKVRFISNSFMIDSNKHINLSVDFKGEILTTSCEVGELIRYRFREKNLLKSISYNVVINKQESDEKEIHLTIQQTESVERNIVIPIETFYNQLKVKPEILYIGQSFNILNRLKGHEKIVEIHSSKKDYLTRQKLKSQYEIQI